MTARTRLFESRIALVERVECRASRPVSAEDYSPEFQIAFPCRGVFVWHVEHDAVLSDPNQVLFIRGGEAYRIAHRPPDGFVEVIITPAQSLLRQVTETLGFDLETHPLFSARSRRATPDLQYRCASFVQQAAGVPRDEFHGDEELVALMRDALAMEPPRRVPAPNTRRLIRRTKKYSTRTSPRAFCSRTSPLLLARHRRISRMSFVASRVSPFTDISRSFVSRVR